MIIHMANKFYKNITEDIDILGKKYEKNLLQIHPKQSVCTTQWSCTSDQDQLSMVYVSFPLCHWSYEGKQYWQPGNIQVWSV